MFIRAFWALELRNAEVFPRYGLCSEMLEVCSSFCTGELVLVVGLGNQQQSVPPITCIKIPTSNSELHHMAD
eukprot:1435029-Amphidinium_carterae.1